jgi:hypothetical protein
MDNRKKKTKFLDKNQETGFRFPVQVPIAQPSVLFANPDMAWYHTDPGTVWILEKSQVP